MVYVTGLYHDHGSFHQSNLKSYKVIGFLNTSQHGDGFSDCLQRHYLEFTSFASCYLQATVMYCSYTMLKAFDSPKNHDTNTANQCT